VTDAPLSFRATLDAALRYFALNGYASQEALDGWLLRLRQAAERDLGDPDRVDDAVRVAMEQVYRRLVDSGKIERFVPGVPRYTVDQFRPRMREELDRRILSASGLIRFNRAEAVDSTLRRFAGWATSVPAGGGPVDLTEAKVLMAKDLRKYRYHRRLVQNDQGHKLVANVAEIAATGAGAIAGRWNSHFRDASYDFRQAHKERDGVYYVVRGSWADEQGLISHPDGYTDEITAPGQEVNCRCWYTWVTSPRNLPGAMLTAKGRAWVAWGDAQAEGRAA
jgi:hypothetical protein